MTRDPWRLRCPQGHTAIIRRTPGPTTQLEEAHWYCRSCGAGDGDPRHGHAVDAKTGEEVPA